MAKFFQEFFQPVVELQGPHLRYGVS
jgi:hypothetical protein